MGGRRFARSYPSLSLKGKFAKGGKTHTFVIIITGFILSVGYIKQEPLDKIALSSHSSAQETFTDTIYSSPGLDGGIAYCFQNSLLFANSADIGRLGCGDSWDLGSGRTSFRSYISFNLAFSSESVTVVEAVVAIYQWDCCGNGVDGRFPVWNVPGGDTLFCIMDHIDYGDSLDTTDWTAGDEGDLQTLTSNIGVISKDSVIEWKKMNVTQYFQADIDAGRERTQFRIRFPILSDFDGWPEEDYLSFYSGDAEEKKPYLAIEYKLVGVEETNPQYTTSSHLEIVPNPFNTFTIIRYSLQSPSLVTLKIYDLSGREVITLVSESKKEGIHTVSWDGKDKYGNSMRSGIYFCRLIGRDFRITKRMMIIK